MNQITINNNIRSYLDLSFKNLKNVVAVHGSESLEHFLKKSEICYKLKRENRSFITEARLKRKGFIPDILVISEIPMVAYEIVCCEREDSLIRKSEVYEEIRIIPIRV